MKMKILVFMQLFIFCMSSFAEFKTDVAFRPKVKTPTYTKNHPKILVDQGHFNFAFDTGRYDAAVGLLESDGYKIISKKLPFTQDLLKDFDILFISAVSPPLLKGQPAESASGFTDDEILVVKNWVQAGGALLLMTDHPPAMAYSSEKLANAFGIYGSLATTKDKARQVKELNDPSIIVFEEDQLNTTHPIIKGRNESERIKKVIAFTGQSLKGPKGSIAVVSFSDTAVDHLLDNTMKPAKDRAEIIAHPFGKGRVVVSGDASYITSKEDSTTNEKHGMNRTGSDNVQLVLNVFHWLSGELK